VSNGSYLYPDQVGNPRNSHHSIVPGGQGSHFGIGGWFDPTAFANPVFGTFGTAHRNSLIGPGYSNVDLSIGKEFPIVGEKLKLEIRADAYNVFNHVNYANPDANVGYTCASYAVPCGASNGGSIGDSAAGISNGPAGSNSNMRIMQLGARFIF